MAGRIDTLTKTFHAYSSAFSTDRAAEGLDAGGKVLLPSSFLAEVTRSSLVYPIQLLIQTRFRKAVYCGVLSFVAPEGQVILPYWMLQHLQIEEGTVVQVQTCSLPKASIIKLRPHEKIFTELSNPRAVLEASLKNHTCLTRGTTISVSHAGTKFAIDVLDIKGAMGNDEKAVLVVDSDVKVEFERPLDMPPTPPRSPVQSPFNVANGVVSGGAFGSNSSNTVGGAPAIAFGSGAAYKPPGGGPPTSTGELPTKMPTLEPRFTAFKGTGMNLKGQVVTNNNTGANLNSTTNSSAPSTPATGSLASTGTGAAGRTLGSGSGGPVNPALAALQRRLAANTSSASATPTSPPPAVSPTPSTAASGTPTPTPAPEAAPAFVPFGGAGRKLKDK